MSSSDDNKITTMDLHDDNSIAGDDTSSVLRSSTHDGGGTSSSETDETTFGKSQVGERAVRCSRLLFFFVLFTAAAVLASVVYVVLRNEETDGFEVQLQNVAGELILLSNNNAEAVFGTLLGLSVSATSYIKAEHETEGYPEGFVTMPDIHYQLATARNITSSLVIAYMPSVEQKDYDSWINYTEEKKGWIGDSNNVTNQEIEIKPYIWEYAEFDDDGSHTRRQLMETCSDTSRRLLAESIPVPSNMSQDLFSPVWTMDPPPPMEDVGIINYNLRDRPVFKRATELIAYTRMSVFLDVCDQAAWFGVNEHKEVLQTVVATPVFANFQDDSKIVGHFTSIIPWETFFSNNLIDGTEKLQLVMSNTCDERFTFDIDGPSATFIGEEDLHDPRYTSLGINAPFADLFNPKDLNIASLDDHCVYTMAVYPTAEFEEAYRSSQPWFYSLAVLAIFAFTSLAFVLFDCFVTQRQQRLLQTAQKQNAIVSSLFPKNIHTMLMDEVGNKDIRTGKSGLRTFLHEGNGKSDADMAKPPIADLFPYCTVLFADISGFTAWSSTREPCHVFTLLENVYGAFDALAKKRKVFKVETVGDCYVAVTGLPDPSKSHALTMCRFAQDCLETMNSKTNELELILGPGTGNLGLRIGLHSGPVVAGVLRGERSRFQLFGDTMNVCSRMESTGVANRIQVSEQTADLLRKAGKEDWLTLRKETVEAKGKGTLQTYFLTVGRYAETSTSATGDSDSSIDAAGLSAKKSRAAEWIVDVLTGLLKDIVSERRSRATSDSPSAFIRELEQESMAATGNIIDEVATGIALPGFKTRTGQSGDLKLGEEVITELREYVQTVASLYHDNPFHCFEHASHVTMSCVKLLSRIAAPDLAEDASEKSVHDHTYGIASDPLTRFSIIVAALVHDVDHSGFSNDVIVKEQWPLAATYQGRSVAEQNSFDISWSLLMEPAYSNLRHAIYTTDSEFKRFRQLLINSVMATDIVNKDLKQLRNERWRKAFDTSSHLTAGHDVKATIVIEHLIQASDVAHTMQHWTVYRKWNEKFFHECYNAFKQGKVDQDPAESWYQGELGFFDFYIIPLAKKLKECGVFGVSSDEYLSYALQNREEWEQRGQQVVAQMMEKRRKIKD